MDKSNKPKNKKSQEHNNFFITLMQTSKNAIDFIKAIAPEELRREILFDTIAYCSNNFVDEENKAKISDMIIRFMLQGGSTLEIYFLIEHKSTKVSTQKIFNQLLGYMAEMWRDDEKHNRPNRLIIPIVFYHGKQKWNNPREFIDQFKVNDEIKKYLLNFKYLLFDTNVLDIQEELLFKENPNLQVGLIALQKRLEDSKVLLKAILDVYKNNKEFF